MDYLQVVLVTKKPCFVCRGRTGGPKWSLGKNCKMRKVVQASNEKSYLSIETLWVSQKCLSPQVLDNRVGESSVFQFRVSKRGLFQWRKGHGWSLRHWSWHPLSHYGLFVKSGVPLHQFVSLRISLNLAKSHHISPYCTESFQILPNLIESHHISPNLIKFYRIWSNLIKSQESHQFSDKKLNNT